MNKND